MRFRWSIVLAAALAAVLAGTVAPARAGTRTPCGPSGFAYAGLQPARNGHGIAAVLTALAQPSVESGHVAGWVGVGGPGQGVGGTDEWLQAGLNSLPGTGNTLYYEVMRPGSGGTYVEVETDVPTGHQFQVKVLETASAPGVWRVWVDGRPVSPPISTLERHSADADGDGRELGWRPPRMQPLQLPLLAPLHRRFSWRLLASGS